MIGHFKDANQATALWVEMRVAGESSLPTADGDVECDADDAAQAVGEWILPQTRVQDDRS